MEFSFLGTSSGVPTKQRNVSGLAIRTSNNKMWCLVDCGEGTQHQILHTPYSLVQLDVIFITHVHGDHCYGLPGLLASAAMAGRRSDLTVVAPEGVAKFVNTCIDNTAMFLPYKINFVDVANINEIETENFVVRMIELSHRVPSYAFRFEEKQNEKRLDTKRLEEDGIPQGPIWGRLLKEEVIVLDDGKEIVSENYILANNPQRVVIVGGDNDTPELMASQIEGVDVVIHEATYTQRISDQLGETPQHCSAKKIACFAEKYKLKHLVLTHFSARYHGSSKGDTIDELRDEASQEYRGNLYLAEDFSCFKLGKNGEKLSVSSLRSE